MFSKVLFCAVLVAVFTFVACRGEDTSPIQFHPVPDVLPEMPPIVMMATELHTMAIGDDGSLWAFGGNWMGQLGDGTTLNLSFFNQISTDTNWTHVATGTTHTVAVRTDGTLWAWGFYERTWLTGLGNGTTTGSNVPIQIGYGADWVSVAAGNMHTMAIKTDGSLWGWGSGNRGQIGTGGGNDVNYIYLSPIQIGIDTDWAYVFAGEWRTMAIKADGSLWGWGANGNGQLGDGTREYRHSPVQIGTDTDWVYVSLSNRQSVALKADGSLWIWGVTSLSQFTDTLGVALLSPEQIGIDTDWVSVAAGDGYNVATKEDGSLWVWGRNAQLFFGGLADRDHTVPTQIHPYEHWVNVAAGNNRVFAITQDGRIQRLGR